MSWPSIPIISCARIVGGSTPDTNSAELWGGGIPWATPKDLSELSEAFIASTPRTITAAGLASCSAELLPPFSVLFSSRAPIGHVAINTVPMATNQGFKSFIPDIEKLDAKFLYHWLRANKEYLNSLGNGATFKEVSKEVMSRVKIPLPPIGEQRRIAAILDQAEALQAKRRQALAKLDTLTQSIFLEMFGELVTPASKWPVADLGAICDVRDGTHDSPVFHDSGYPLVTSKNLRYGRVDLKGAKFISEADYSEINRRSKVNIGDILMPMIGTIGNPVIVSDEPTYAVKNICIIKFPSGSPSVHYLHALLSGNYFDRVTSWRSRGGTQRFLALGEIRRLPIPVPDEGLQKKFESIVCTVKTARDSHQSSLNAIDSVRDALVHRAFRGEL